MKKIINSNQLKLVFLGLEQQFKKSARDVQKIRTKDAVINHYDNDTTVILQLLKEIKDSLKFVKRCIQEFDSRDNFQQETVDDHEENSNCSECDGDHLSSESCDLDCKSHEDDNGPYDWDNSWNSNEEE